MVSFYSNQAHLKRFLFVRYSWNYKAVCMLVLGRKVKPVMNALYCHVSIRYCTQTHIVLKQLRQYIFDADLMWSVWIELVVDK